MSELSPAQISMQQSKRKAAWLLLQLAELGFDASEYIGQFLAGMSESGAGVPAVIAQGAAGLNRMAELIENPEHIWPELIPGGPGPVPTWEVVDIDTVKSLEEDIENLRAQLDGKVMDIGHFGENEVLPYPLDYHHGDDVYHCAAGAEFFTDHQGHQWVKFFPMNGRNPNMEHMFRVVPTQDYVVRVG